jgi:hypothetical protein
MARLKFRGIPIDYSFYVSHGRFVNDIRKAIEQRLADDFRAAR